MARRREQPRKRPSRVKLFAERVILGAAMSIAVWIAERRLRRMLSGEGGPKR